MTAATLAAILDNAAEGTTLQPTLTSESVQVLLFALSLASDYRVWLTEPEISLSDVDRDTIEHLLSGCAYEMLP